MAIKFSKKELSEILRKHKRWLSCKDDGERADLSGADFYEADLHGVNLRGADLHKANLSGADLTGADLSYADLYVADLYSADLRGANLHKANLRGTNFSGADLSDADLSNADLYGADLYRAHLRGADLSGIDLSGADILYPMACPDTGSFIGWKKVSGPYIVKLLITEDAKRSSAMGRKCRCNKAKVIAIENMDGTPSDVISVHSAYDAEFVYKVGSEVYVDDFNEDRFKECAPGIHFFINRQEAVNYNF